MQYFIIIFYLLPILLSALYGAWQLLIVKEEASIGDVIIHSLLGIIPVLNLLLLAVILSNLYRNTDVLSWLDYTFNSKGS